MASWRLLHPPAVLIGHQGVEGDGQLHAEGEAHEEVHYSVLHSPGQLATQQVLTADLLWQSFCFWKGEPCRKAGLGSWTVAGSSGSWSLLFWMSFGLPRSEILL